MKKKRSRGVGNSSDGEEERRAREAKKVPIRESLGGSSVLHAPGLVPGLQQQIFI